jgi:catechol 2,3-dioxygenase
MPLEHATTGFDPLPDATRLGVAHLQVTNLPRSLAYYERVIGLTLISASASEAILGAADSRSLLILHEHRGARPVARHSRLGLYHFAILLPDRPSLGRFLTHLADTGAHAATADHAVSEAVYLWDPDGLGIEVYSDRPRSEWRLRAGEVYMTTEPLDVGSLEAAAAGQRWTGAPPGTTMGHMHLHVGSIHEAEAFYHRALGLNKTVTGYPGALFMSAGGYHHHLGANTWAAGAPPSTDTDARLLEWTIVLPTAADVDRAAARMENGGYLVKREGRDRWRVPDPWGTTLCVRESTSDEAREGSGRR